MSSVPNWYYQQSGVIPYQWVDGKILVLLITSQKRKRWVIPKGVVEPQLTPGESALKEAAEEAGITGMMSPQPVGTYQYSKWEGTCSVEVFLLEVTEIRPNWPEKGLRDRQWMTIDQAVEVILERDLQTLLRQLPEWVNHR